jgi:hypothetical protein
MVLPSDIFMTLAEKAKRDSGKHKISAKIFVLIVLSGCYARKIIKRKFLLWNNY